MGITWRTFSGNAAKPGYAATPETFKEMPPEIWLKIYKGGFWDGVRADLIHSQAIGEFLADWAWGSHSASAGKKLQHYLHTFGNALKPDGKVGPITIGLLNALIQKREERVVLEDLDLGKRNYLKEVKYYKKFGLGSYNRMDYFHNYAVGIIK